MTNCAQFCAGEWQRGGVDAEVERLARTIRQARLPDDAAFLHRLVAAEALNHCAGRAAHPAELSRATAPLVVRRMNAVEGFARPQAEHARHVAVEVIEQGAVGEDDLTPAVEHEHDARDAVEHGYDKRGCAGERRVLGRDLVGGGALRGSEWDVGFLHHCRSTRANLA